MKFYVTIDDEKEHFPLLVGAITFTDFKIIKVALDKKDGLTDVRFQTIS